MGTHYEDFSLYLQSADGKRAEPWQLEQLASMRRTAGEAVSQKTYESMRRALAADHAERTRERATNSGTSAPSGS